MLSNSCPVLLGSRGISLNRGRGGLGTVTDLLLRQAQASRAGALKAMTITTSSVLTVSSSDAFLRPPHRLWGHPGCGRWLTGITRTARRRTNMRQHGTPLCRHSLKVGTVRREPTRRRGLAGSCHESRQLYGQIYGPKKITKA